MNLYRVSKKAGKYTLNFSDSLNVNTSVHHVLSVPNAEVNGQKLFYAVGEGAPKEGISPFLTAFEISDGSLVPQKTLHLPPGDMNVNEMGSHHANFHPDGIHIYLGSNEGKTFVIDRNSMSIVTTIDTGKGNGHTTMIPGRMLGISTNHDDNFFTIIDLNTHQKKAIIKLNVWDRNWKRKAQGHTSSFDPTNDRYFYTSVSDAGRIIEIDMETLSISRDVELKCGSYPIQGVFVW